MLPRLRHGLAFTLLLVALAAGCKARLGDDTAEANKLLDEARAGIAAGDKMSQDGYSKFKSYANAETMKDFPSNREQIRPVAQESADLFGRSAQTYREQVIPKLDAAGKMSLNEKFKEYITLKAEAFRKLADSKEVGKELALTPLDPSFTTQEALLAKVREIDARLNAAVKEYQEINDRANKIQQENPDVIGAPPG